MGKTVSYRVVLKKRSIGGQALEKLRQVKKNHHQVQSEQTEIIVEIKQQEYTV